jgi:hypothetical protein
LFIYISTQRRKGRKGRKGKTDQVKRIFVAFFGQLRMPQLSAAPNTEERLPISPLDLAFLCDLCALCVEVDALAEVDARLRSRFPIHRVLFEVGVDGGAYGGMEACGAEALDHLKALQLVLDRIL